MLRFTRKLQKQNSTMKYLPIKRYSYAITATLLLLSVFFPLFKPVHAGASQLTSRRITMSDSGASGQGISGVGGGASVQYQVAFTLTTNVDALVIDFCANTPIIGDNCNATSGSMSLTSFTAASAALTTAPNDAGQIRNWTSVTASQYRITLAKGTGAQATSASQVFTISGITNPSTRGSFYARIYTYTAANAASYSSPTSLGTYSDYGGIALAINQIIRITARVQETLSFCVTGLNPSLWTTKDCTDATATATAPSLVLGHGTPTATLDASQDDSGTVFSQLSTNASSGAAIAMRNNNNANSCTNGGLSADFGQTCAIPGVGSTAALIVPGIANFGLYVWNSEAADASSVGTVAPAALYRTTAHTTFTTTAGASLTAFTSAASASSGSNNSGDIFPDATNVFYGMDASTGGVTPSAVSPYNNVLTTFGHVVAACTAPVYKINNAYTFTATAALTTPAGIYTANLDLIATGTF